MKLRSPTLLILALCFMACKDNSKEEPTPEPKTYNVAFNSSSVAQANIASATNASESIKVNAKMLYYYVFNSNDELVYNLVQDSSYSNFGSISHKLEAGVYTSYIVGGQASLIMNPYGPNVIYYNSFSREWKDTFFKKISLTITNADINQDVKLDRIVGQIQFVIEDAIPVQAKSLVFTIDKDLEKYNYLLGTFDNEQSKTFVVDIPASAVGTKNFKVTRIIGNTIKPLTLTVRCFGSNQSLLVEKVIPDIQCKRNVSTIITGKLFGDPGQSVSVSVDNAWVSTPYATVQF